MAIKRISANEKKLEGKLRDEIKYMGGLAIKFSSYVFTGFPDRIILMPGGKVYFVEMKSTGKTPSDRQHVVLEMLRKLGFNARVIDSEEKLESFLTEISAK